MDVHIQKFKSLNIPSECGVSIKIQDKIIKLLTDLDLESLLISPNDFYEILMLCLIILKNCPLMRLSLKLQK